MQANEIHGLLVSKLGVWRNDNLPYTGRLANTDLVMQILGEIGPETGIELGPHRSAFTEMLCKAIPKLHLTAIGMWPNDAEFQDAQAKLAAYSVSFLRQPTMLAVEEIADHSVDLLFINPTGGFDQIILDIINWVPKVRPGGVIMGSHFCHSHRGGVVPAVEAYVRSHNIVPWYITRLDVEPLWFWVN